LRPGTFSFIDTLAIWWVIALLILAMFVVGDAGLDAKLKPVKFLSLGLIVFIIALGVYTNGPVCVFVESEVVLATVLAAVAVIVLSGILSSAWCRYACPEGAALGLLARQSRWRIAKDDARCTACRSCEPSCPVQAIQVGERDETTCVLCGKCTEVCPAQALTMEDGTSPDRGRNRQPGRT
jgi:polyferredoxin